MTNTLMKEITNNLKSYGEDNTELHGYTLHIEVDSCPGNPRVDWDNFCEFQSEKSDRYQDIDETSYTYRELEILEEIFTSKNPDYSDLMEFNGQDDYVREDIRDYMREYKRDIAHIVQVNTGSLTSYGIITWKALKEAGHDWKRTSTKRLELMEKWIEGEASVYSSWACGEVYSYSIHKDDEVMDSCYGFYGDDHKVSGLFEMLENALSSELESKRKAKLAQTKLYVRNRVPLEARI